MAEFGKEITPINIEQELKQSYLGYAMSVIVGRALPDVRDGLKPVHRRSLFAMSELGNDWNKPYKKSARVVGEVIGKYHPHGDTSVYDTIVRMAQPFSLRYMLVDGQGNFGSVDGDSPAAMRYTEVRMSRLTHMLLADLEKETVDFVPNYDETEYAPAVLPSRVPNLLVNGSSGIAVGMATNIPPHNLTEVINGCVALIDMPAITVDELMHYIPGPDFPTAGIINGRAGIVQAYRTGRGRIYVRAKTAIEVDAKGRQTIVVNELPYQVNKARLIEKIAELVKEKRIEGIVELRDESDKDGMRITIDLRRGENSDVVLNNLFTHTQMQSVFGINMVALVDGQPRVLDLKQIIEAFVRHRREVVTRRTIYDLRKARERAHILEGLAIALTNIDEMIALIKAAANPAEARVALLAKCWPLGMLEALLQETDSNVCRPDDLSEQYGARQGSYYLSPTQAQAILDLRLHRLTGLEQDKIINEYRTILANIKDLLEILANPTRLMNVIREELIEIREQFGDARRTEILDSQHDLTVADLIPEEDVVVTLSHQGYAKAQPLALYQAQRRGGKGKTATSVKDEDFVERLLVANSHDTLLCFSSMGKVYWLKAYQVPMSGRMARGKPIVNLLSLQENETITAITAIREFSDDKYVLMATACGVIKKVVLNQFSRPRANGIIALELNEQDKLVGVEITDGTHDIMLFTNAGKAIRFKDTAVRATGRTAKGVRGVSLEKGQRVISLAIASTTTGWVLTTTEHGYGKRTELGEYRLTGRGGRGVISIQTNERNGGVIGAMQVFPGDEVMLISNKGTLVRTRVDEISLIGRNTQGVRLINLTNGEQLVGLQRIEEDISEATDSSDEENT
jgi:DNA gyrase subunit A